MGIKKSNQQNKPNNNPKPSAPIEPVVTPNADDVTNDLDTSKQVEMDLETPEMIAIKKLESEIVEETIKITTHQTSSCYKLVQLGKELIELRKTL